MSAMTVFQRMPKPLAAALAMAGTLAAGVAGGYAARTVHLPLPWLLGALFTTMALSLTGAPVRLIPWGRPAGTIVVGASTGLQFTAAVVEKLVTLLPLIIAAAFLSTIVGAIGGLIYMRLTGRRPPHSSPPFPAAWSRPPTLPRNMAGTSSPSWWRRPRGWR